MIGAFLASAFQNNAFQVGEQYGVWGATGGVEKRKHEIHKNQRPVIEQAISDAIAKVLGTDNPEPELQAAVYKRVKEPKNDFDYERLILEIQAQKLGQTIAEYENALYEARLKAELDDEETLLFLL